jgi:tyrosine aminotransferase
MYNHLTQVRKGLVNLSQLTLGANSLIQAAIPEILAAPKSFHVDTMTQLEMNANLSRELLTGIPGLTPVFPQGAMYLMVSPLNASSKSTWRNSRTSNRIWSL